MTLPLTTIEAVKAVLALTDTAQDDVLTSLIVAVSQDAEKYMKRHIQSMRRTEIYTVHPNQSFLSLRGFPITEVHGVRRNSLEDFELEMDLATTYYVVKKPIGQIRFTSTSASTMYAQVDYTGGMAVDTAAFIAAEARISQAAVTEVIARFNRRKNPEGNLRAFETGVAYEKQMSRMTDFEMALDPRRRLSA
jgi:hypothetical protein